MNRTVRIARDTVGVLAEAFREWQRDNALELGAALAYYTVLSIAPVLVIVIAVAGLAFGREAAQGEIFNQFRGLIGPDGALVVQAGVESASRPSSGIIATIVGLVVLIVGASGAFGQLQTSLNRLWNVAPPPRSAWRNILRQRVTSFALVVAIGFLLLVSLIISAALAAVGTWIANRFPGLQVVLGVSNELLSFVVITMLITLMFRTLPDLKLAWRDLLVGGAITSLLFVAGKALIGFYVSRTHVGAAYGVAGSIVVVLVWVYYTSQILFYGAECTQVFAERYGSLAGVTRPRWKPGGITQAEVNDPAA